MRSNNITIYTRSLLFGVILVYFAQGSIYARGSIISQLCLVAMLSLSGYYFFRSFLLRRSYNLFFNSWTGLLLLNVFGFIVSGNYSSSAHFGMFKGIIISSLLFYPFYFFAHIGMLEPKHLTMFFFLMLPVTILQYYFNADQILAERITTNTDLVNNRSYSFVWLVPFVFLFAKRRWLSMLSLAIVMFFVIDGAKRGAVITGVLGLFLFIPYQIRTVDRKNRSIGYLLVGAGVIILSYVTYNFYQANEFLISRVGALDEGGSGRDRIFVAIFEVWQSSRNFFNLVFGYGFASSIEFAGNYAHNDWLELLSNFGLFGVFIYGMLFYAAIRYLWNKQIPVGHRWLMLTIVLMWFFISLFSMGYTNSDNGYLRAILLAFLIGSRSKQK
jgi:O-antigen ligase